MGKYNTVGFVRHHRNTGTVCKILTHGVSVMNPREYLIIIYIWLAFGCLDGSTWQVVAIW